MIAWLLTTALAGQGCEYVRLDTITSLQAPAVIVLGERHGHQPDLRRARKVVEELLDSVQFHVDAQSWLGGQAAPRHHAALEDRLNRLSELLFDVIPLSAIDRLWIAPHAGLVQVPWAALPAGELGNRY